ncbi:Proteasome subunit beta, bacterial [hydrothermal vent metagenome]|uniref:Proteasome subunit beta, bacterial n=1 Tax=hydrothermal vent metagenome TaxID=652676 RepID=A0A3B0SP61_9ZZZZ
MTHERHEPSSALPVFGSHMDTSFLSLLDQHGMTPSWTLAGNPDVSAIPEATTILAIQYAGGVVMAGDRRATAGNVIAHTKMKKVYPADKFSAVAISGTAGMAVEMIKLFQTELEHYEKIEGMRLSLEGKANYLARMVRGNLSLAFQGLVVVPLFCGYDEHDQTGRLYTFDVVGGRYEEDRYAATGSGGTEARSFLKGVYEADASEETAMRWAVEALIAAAEEDAATGGPDIRRGIFPTVVVVGSEGFREISDDALAPLAASILENRP